MNTFTKKHRSIWWAWLLEAHRRKRALPGALIQAHRAHDRHTRRQGTRPKNDPVPLRSAGTKTGPNYQDAATEQRQPLRSPRLAPFYPEHECTIMKNMENKMYVVTLRSKSTPHRIEAATVQREDSQLVFRDQNNDIVGTFNNADVMGYSIERHDFAIV
jgi:hypothetical protein